MNGTFEAVCGSFVFSSSYFAVGEVDYDGLWVAGKVALITSDRDLPTPPLQPLLLCQGRCHHDDDEEGGFTLVSGIAHSKHPRPHADNYMSLGVGGIIFKFHILAQVSFSAERIDQITEESVFEEEKGLAKCISNWFRSGAPASSHL